MKTKILSYYPPIFLIGPETGIHWMIIDGKWIESPLTNDDIEWERITILKKESQINPGRTFDVESEKNPNVKYTVTYHNSLFTCTCPSFGFRRKCKHIEHVKEFIES